MAKPARRTAWTAAAILAIATVATFASMRVRRVYRANTRCCAVPAARNLALSVREALGLAKFYGQFGQDRWAAETVFPGVSDGFFLDVGSGDGTHDSNSKALEARGWTGICVDPFPTQMEGRTCRLFRDVVSNSTGQRVQFKAAGLFGGIAGDLNQWKQADVVRQSPTVEFITVSLADVLDRANAPLFIHFVSLDIEGAELKALQGFPFDRYTIGAMAVEHNYEEPKRSEIEALMHAHGYARVHTFMVDDFYLRRR